MCRTRAWHIVVAQQINPHPACLYFSAAAGSLQPTETQAGPLSLHRAYVGLLLSPALIPASLQGGVVMASCPQVCPGLVRWPPATHTL